MIRPCRARWIVFWVFAVPLLVLVGIMIWQERELGLAAAVLLALQVAWQVAWIRRAERREAAGEPAGPDSPVVRWYRWFWRSGTRIPEGHGPGDPDVTLYVEQAPGTVLPDEPVEVLPDAPPDDIRR